MLSNTSDHPFVRKVATHLGLAWAGGSLLLGHAQASILPPNDLHLQDNPSLIENMTEEEFNTIITEATDIYKDLATKNGATLKANALWTNSTVNASANQVANTWNINMYGGLARRPEVTKDGFALVVCHELGHHFGGFAFIGSGWAANEGQSDYFATQTCARRLWAKDKQTNALFRDQVGDFERNACDDVYERQEDQDLCYRIAAAGLSLGRLLAALGGNDEPSFETPSTKKVNRTDNNHPAAQCRLDTYFAGALCTKAFDINAIPGRKHPKGQSSLDAELVAAQSSCTQQDNLTVGLRPSCWFRSRLKAPEVAPMDWANGLSATHQLRSTVTYRGFAPK